MTKLKEKLEGIARMTNDMGIINPHEAKLLLEAIADVEKMRDVLKHISNVDKWGNQFPYPLDVCVRLATEALKPDSPPK